MRIDGLKGVAHMAKSDGNNGRAKKPYSAPVLTVYGSVRELTGSVSGAANGDGLGMAMGGM
jgi:hypothetical protein